MTTISQLNWRYATKRMNSTDVPEQKLQNILEAIRLAPTSYGLMPYSIIVVQDKELLRKINAEACQQPQILEGSCLLVFAAWDDIKEKQVDEYMQLVSTTRGVPVDGLKGFKDMIMQSVSKMSQAERVIWAAKQAYLALGVGLTAAALEGVDTTPMEGFNPAKMDEVLGLAAKGLISTVLMMIGYRDITNDTMVAMKKVRRSSEDLFIKM